MNPMEKQALSQKLLAMADDELILGHRVSEWTGHAPILEEDIAFSNIAQDEIGHAIIWYSLLQDLTNETPDRMVFFRDPDAYRNIQMVELPNGDWACTVLRQYFFDTAEMLLLSALLQSTYQPIAAAAAKMRNEEIYHYRHTSTWVKRLGLGTEESNQRMQNGLNILWPYAQQLFVPLPDDALLVDKGIVPDLKGPYREWLQIVHLHLEKADLQIPENDQSPATNRSEHTEHLTALLEDMQQVARFDPQAQW